MEKEKPITLEGVTTRIMAEINTTGRQGKKISEVLNSGYDAVLTEEAIRHLRQHGYVMIGLKDGEERLYKTKKVYVPSRGDKPLESA